MLTTLIIAIFLGLWLPSQVLTAVFLWLGLRWTKVEGVTIRRVAAATVLMFVLELVANVIVGIGSPTSEGETISHALAGLIVIALTPGVLIPTLFHARLWQSILAWLTTLIPNVALLAFIFLVFRPFCFEAFVIPTNSMAPTILGKHWRGTCPMCGMPNYCSPKTRFLGEPPSGLLPDAMICDNFHIEECLPANQQVGGGDRILCAKFLKPKRWDLVVFRCPDDPSTNYLKRLVGLPGEEIRIEDGAVWANGERLVPPPEIAGISYLSPASQGHVPTWGSPDHPAKLGPDEYFMLGDFSARAKDSRYWEQGAPGHNPYAVPESYLTGVVTQIYWPPSRWRAFW